MQLTEWGYPNGQIPLSAMLEFEGSWFHPEMYRRIAWAVPEARYRAGNPGIVTVTEGYRALGVPGDFLIRDASQTSTGGSNQWYQKGRESRGETPSAATPGYSTHGFALAADLGGPGANSSLVVGVFEEAGLLFTIPSEPWHCDASGTPNPAIPPLVIPATVEQTELLEHIYPEDDMTNYAYPKDPVTGVLYQVNLDDLHAPLRIVGKLTGAGKHAAGLPKYANPADSTEVGINILIEDRGVEATPKALYANLKKNQPPVKGLSLVPILAK